MASGVVAMLGARQPQREGGTQTRCTLHSNPAAVPVNHGLHEHETQPTAGRRIGRALMQAWNGWNSRG